MSKDSLCIVCSKDHLGKQFLFSLHFIFPLDCLLDILVDEQPWAYTELCYLPQTPPSCMCYFTKTCLHLLVCSGTTDNQLTGKQLVKTKMLTSMNCVSRYFVCVKLWFQRQKVGTQLLVLSSVTSVHTKSGSIWVCLHFRCKRVNTCFLADYCSIFFLIWRTVWFLKEASLLNFFEYIYPFSQEEVVRIIGL